LLSRVANRAGLKLRRSGRLALSDGTIDWLDATG